MWQMSGKFFLFRSNSDIYTGHRPAPPQPMAMFRQVAQKININLKGPGHL
jgi:hypothetical protein